jgi:uridine kinase
MSTEESKQLKPFLIGICGGSASGKTTAAYFITKYLGEENCLLFSLDNYFYGPNDEERKHIQDYNFDRPEALDLDLAYKHLLQLRNGETIEMPVYSFNISKRMPYTQKVSPKRVIIFEGIFSLHEKRMRDIMDLKLFFDLDSDIRLARRTIRDISDRSRQIETVLDRYLTFVKPAFDTYIKPTRKYADFVIPQDNFSSLPVEIISQHLSNTLLDIKKNNEEFNKKKECKLSQEECVSKKYFYNPEISCLSVVKEEKEIRKFNKIIHHIIERTKTSFYSLYCNVIVQYLLETQKKKNKNENNLRVFYFDETQLNNNLPIIQNIKDENNNCIISIFAPILIQMKEKFKMDLIRFINEFKERKVQFELLSVYMSYNTFNQLNEVLACNNVSMNFITIYFGDDLLKNKTILENGGFISSNSVDFLFHFITPENLINEFHLNENN